MGVATSFARSTPGFAIVKSFPESRGRRSSSASPIPRGAPRAASALPAERVSQRHPCSRATPPSSDTHLSAGRSARGQFDRRRIVGVPVRGQPYFEGFAIWRRTASTNPCSTFPHAGPDEGRSRRRRQHRRPHPGGRSRPGVRGGRTSRRSRADRRARPRRWCGTTTMTTCRRGRTIDADDRRTSKRPRHAHALPHRRDHSNSYARWKAMGSPQSPSPRSTPSWRSGRSRSSPGKASHHHATAASSRRSRCRDRACHSFTLPGSRNRNRASHLRRARRDDDWDLACCARRRALEARARNAYDSLSVNRGFFPLFVTALETEPDRPSVGNRN